MRILKTAAPFLLFFIYSNFNYCQKVELKRSPLIGTWIESEKRTDTIVFSSEYDGQNPIFELKRGFRIAEGYKLPDYYSGPYNFKLGIIVFQYIGSFRVVHFRHIILK